MASFKRLAILLARKICFCARNRIPKTLHLVERVVRLHTLAREALAHLCRLFNSVGFEHVFCALAIEIAIGRVEALRVLHVDGCLLRVAGSLIDFRSHCVEIDERRRVLNRPVYAVERRIMSFEAKKVLREVEINPDDRRRQFRILRRVK